MRQLNLKALTAEAFGYSPLQRFQQPEPLGPKDPPARANPPGPEPTNAGRGLLGLPAFCKISIQGVHTTSGGYEGIELIDPIVTVQQPQNVISTPITGRRGSVKEYINQGDYAVSIRGILASDPFSETRFEYPLPQVQVLRDLVGAGVALPVAGWLLDVYGIKNLVVTNATYESLPGFVNLQAYELQCLSDEPIELTL
ncbi:DUF6046 domain-containing protein [Hymenobacter sp. YC55]|uniref:DUF6046 domain-containing protein n=1 Tax=Hymenobacter sp. YC55 TaxID=3034019 RepID=UPI0023F99A6A|nr:DUF6046 domain-containing protein [Hymenobacter sp. YC55]MDF7809909.1 DUF6046 domain-containing protein [Hymenobacter sp. YC55]